MPGSSIQKELESSFLNFAKEYIDNPEKIVNQDYDEFIEEISGHEKEDIVSAALNAIIHAEGPVAFVIISFLRDIVSCPTFPYETQLRMEDAKNDEEVLIKLLSLYSAFFYIGYKQLIPLEDLISRYRVDTDVMDRYIKKHVSATGALGNIDVNSTDILEEARSRIDKIKPIVKTMPITRGTGAFESPIPIKIPVRQIIKMLGEIKDNLPINPTESPFFKPLGSIEESISNPLGKKIASQIDQGLRQGRYDGLMMKMAELEKLEPDNPRIHLEKSLLILDVMAEKSKPGYHLAQAEIVKVLNAPTCQLNFDYFHQLIMNSQMLGHFHASYIISLALISIFPIDFNSLISAAYDAYQLMKPFKHFLLAAATVDPARLLNFLNEYWYEFRFKLQDSFAQLKISQDEITEFEEDVSEIIDCIIMTKTRLESSLFQALKSKDNELYAQMQEKILDVMDVLSRDYADDEGIMEDSRGSREDNDDVNQWFDDVLPKWQRSQLYKELPKFTWNTRDDIPRMATRLYYDSHAKLPGDWNWSNLEQVLLEAFPKNVSAPKYYFKTIARVMMNFCSFLHESQALQNLAGMKEKIQKLSPKICERIEETRAWSSGKRYFF